jgi:hypothetical protein
MRCSCARDRLVILVAQKQSGSIFSLVERFNPQTEAAFFVIGHLCFLTSY